MTSQVEKSVIFFFYMFSALMTTSYKCIYEFAVCKKDPYGLDSSLRWFSTFALKIRLFSVD